MRYRSIPTKMTGIKKMDKHVGENIKKLKPSYIADGTYSSVGDLEFGNFLKC